MATRPLVKDDLAVTGPLYAIGRFCSRHHYPTIAVWLALAVGLVVAGQSVDSRTNDCRAWWLPGWMERLIPHVSIEGEEYLANRDAALGAARSD